MSSKEEHRCEAWCGGDVKPHDGGRRTIRGWATDGTRLHRQHPRGASLTAD